MTYGDFDEPVRRSNRPLVRGSFTVQTAQLSPDGRWVVYGSTESGRSELYITEFPHSRTKRPLTTAGGDHPRWRADGHEFFFRSNGKLMAVDISNHSGAITAGPPRELSDIRQAMGAGGPSRYFCDVAPDGQRFLVGMRTIVGEQSAEQGEVAGSITVVVNWSSAFHTQQPGR